MILGMDKGATIDEIRLQIEGLKDACRQRIDERDIIIANLKVELAKRDETITRLKHGREDT